MAVLIGIMAVLVGLATAEFESQTCNFNRMATIQPSADAFIGGIFGIHRSGTNGYGCGMPSGSMQAYEAVRYALDLVNKKDEILNGEYLKDYYVPGIKLGMEVIDYCMRDDAGIAAVSSLFPTLASDSRSCTKHSNMTLGIIGTSGSDSSAAVSDFAEMFDIPVVSFMATAKALTYSGSHPNFLRTIPPDNDLVEVLGQVLVRLGWKYVVVVYEDTSYGREAYNALLPILENSGICLTAAFMVDSDDNSAATAKNIVEQVVATGTVGTIFLGYDSVGTALLEQGSNVNGAGKLQWIMTDMPLETTFTFNYARGVLVLVPASRYIVEFEDHWVRIDEENPSAENPWFREWYMNKYQCNLAGVSTYNRQCSSLFPNMNSAEKERRKRLTFVQDQFVEPAMHAVFTYANALKMAQAAKCGVNSQGICQALSDMTHEDFLNNYVKKVSFTYAAQERVPSLASDQYAPYKAAKKLRYDPRGDIISPSFSLWNYNDLPTGEENSTEFKFREVGYYINGRLSFNPDSMRLYSENRLTPLTPFPASPCPASGCAPCLGVPQKMRYYFQDGDIIINGIFSVHDLGTPKFTCDEIISVSHPLYLEAMIYAVKKVNADNSILNGVTLGGLGIDDCVDPDISTNFIVQVQKDMLKVRDRAGNTMDPRKVEAYTGALTSPLTLPLAQMMDDFLQPLVGYLATSAELDRYKYYIKAMNSMDDEFHAIIMIMKNWGWNHTQVVSTYPYSSDDIMRFRHLAAQAGICVSAMYNYEKEQSTTIAMLSQNSAVRPVVLLMSALYHIRFFSALSKSGMRDRNDFITTSTFSSKMGPMFANFGSVADGVISLDLEYSTLTEFLGELAKKRVGSYFDNPWFEEWFEKAYNCHIGDDMYGFPTPCNTSDVSILDAPKFLVDYRVEHVINAVYALARGLDRTLTKYCSAGYSGVCPQFVTASRKDKGMELLNELRAVSFPIEDTNPQQQFSFAGQRAAFAFNVFKYMSGNFNKIGTVNPSRNTLSLTEGPPSSTVSSCPPPCLECLYMFAFQDYWYLDGDLIISAIFDVHYKGADLFSCGSLRTTNGVQYTETFRYALDIVNSGTFGVKLNGVQLGGLAFDGCTNPERSTAIINGVQGKVFPIMDENGKQLDLSKLVSWLTYDSEVTMEAADLLKMSGTPLVSPGATAPQLLDKEKYSTFFRTIPSDTVIAKAMANFIQERGWKYIITVNAPDAGSRETRTIFRNYLKERGICVIANYEFETDGSVDVILNSLRESTTEVVAVFADPDRYIPEMLRKKENLFPKDNIIFISNRFWNVESMGLKGFPTPSIATRSLSFQLVDSTVANLLSFLSLASSLNPWLPEYYQALFKCNLGGNNMYGSSCTSTVQNIVNSPDFYEDMYTLTTINAVHALAVGLDVVLKEKCGLAYRGVCTRFLTDFDTLDRLMVAMDAMTFMDITSLLFDFIERESNRGFQIMQHDDRQRAEAVVSVSREGEITYTSAWNPVDYSNVKSQCADECLVCESFETDFTTFSYIDGDVYIVGLFDVHTKGTTPYTCGSINKHQGLQLLEAFNYAIDYMNTRQDLFQEKLRGVRIGGIGIDVCQSPTRAANLVANIHSGNIRLQLGGGFEISRRRILAYVGPFDTASTIRVADILSAIGVPQITFGATGLQLQNPKKYPYLLRSVPADDKQSRAIISYLKNFNLTNVQVVSSYESIGETMRTEFLRLASLNLVCIKHNYTIGMSNDKLGEAQAIVDQIVTQDQAKVVVLLVDDPLPILQAAGQIVKAREDFLWVATDKWGYDIEFLDNIGNLLGNRDSRKNVIIFDVETADVPLYDKYLEDKTPDNYKLDPWFLEFYEDQFGCSWSGTGSGPSCDKSRGIPRYENYIQDPYILYVTNAVFATGLAIDEALSIICSGTTGIAQGICLKFESTGDRRDVVMAAMRRVNFMDDTYQPFYFEPTGESSRGYHIYNITTNRDGITSGPYAYENVGSFNDTHFLKLDITYDISYQAYCQPYETCVCVNPFPEILRSRYMLQPSPFELNLVYIGDVHAASPSNPFTCSHINVGADFFKMMAFFYAINRVNRNLDNRFPESLRLGGIALDTCSSTLRLDQDIFNLLSGYPLCDTGKSGQIVPPSSIIAFVPDGNANSIPVSRILASTGITSVSPSATSPELREYVNSEHFLSVVPPDDVQAAVLLQLMSQLRWDYASVIFTNEPSMVAAKDELLKQSTQSQSACVGQALSLPMGATIGDAEAVLDRVSQQVGARAVILFTLPAHTRLLLQAAKNRGQTGRFIWIGTTAWGRNNEAIRGLEQQASGAIILQPHSAFIDDFRNFVKSLTFTNRRGIPDDWFEEIYQTLHRCKIQDAKQSLPFDTLCSKDERIVDEMVPYNPVVLHTVIAVYMVAQGLNQIPSCQGSGLDISACITRLQSRNDEIYQSILSAQWNVLPDLLGADTFSFTFNPAGYGNIGFDIYNYRSSGDSSGYIYSKLGSFTDSLVFNSQSYQGLGLYEEGVIPNSNCIGIECKCQGPMHVYGLPNQWQFSPRIASLVVTEEGRTYQDPRTGKLYYVEKIPNTASRFNDMWGVAVATLAALGVFVSLALFIYLLVVYPVRGGTSILGYVLSFGIILLYGLVFAFVAHADEQICGLRRFCLGFCYAICYSALFVKLVDCWRAREKEDMFEVKYRKLGRPFGLFMVTVMLVLVQVMINAEWLILENPGVERIFYNDQYWPRCTPSDFYDEGLVLSLCYIMVLILLTVLIGFCTFNSTKNHREARWILGMAILSVPIWVIWCAWSILGEMKTRDAAVAVGLLINATVLLLLGPVRKLYLLNKYQTLISEEDRNNEQEERASKVNNYPGYDNQYDNAPQLHDRASAIGSARGQGRYQPSSIGHSGR